MSAAMPDSSLERVLEAADQCAHEILSAIPPERLFTRTYLASLLVDAFLAGGSHAYREVNRVLFRDS